MSRNAKMKSNRLETLFFWGALWGLAEATLGSLLHILPWIAGMVMFPIAFYFMKKALNDTGNLASIFYTSSIAAGIKLAGLLLPWQSPGQVIKPATWILLEGAAVVLFFKVFHYMKNQSRSFSFANILPLTLGWRVLYMIYYLAMTTLSTQGSMQQMSLLTMTRFLVIDAVVNALLINLYLKLEKDGQKSFITRTLKPGFINISCLLAAALLANFI